MKKIITLSISILLCICSIAQKITLNTNGYNLEFTKTDSLFYTEYTTNSTKNLNKKSNDFADVNLKYTFGKISTERAALIDNEVEYHTNFYSYKDGTLEAPTRQLFFKPTNITEFIKQYGKIGIIEEHSYLKGCYYLYVTNKIYKNGESIFSLCTKIFNENLVSVIEPVFTKLITTTNPLRPWQWNIRNNGNVAGGVIGADMSVENAWCNSTGTNVRVAVIDDGVDLAHPDLQANLLPGFDATGNNSGGAPTFNNGHGTNCAGIIASVNNTIGTIGVAFNSRIIPIRMGIVSGPFFNTNDTWQSNCFNEAVNRGADVISNSWSRSGSQSAQLNAAISNAINNGRNGMGCVVLFSTGNDNKEISYPSTLPNVIAVGASTPCDTRKRSSSDPTQVGTGVNTDPEGTSCDGESFWGSNFGVGLDVLAPGVLISTTDNVGSLSIFGE
jgi:subtilisin family serine protease